MIHIYYGDGKGKTTAAVGQAVRAAGCGMPVVFAQFLKGNDSGERRILKQILEITVVSGADETPFFFNMNDEEKANCSKLCTEQFESAVKLAQDGGLLVLDEVLNAVSVGALPEEVLVGFLKTCTIEVILTGSAATESIEKLADYITCMNKISHPFDRGAKCRKGIEF